MIMYVSNSQDIGHLEPNNFFALHFQIYDLIHRFIYEIKDGTKDKAYMSSKMLKYFYELHPDMVAFKSYELGPLLSNNP